MIEVEYIVDGNKSLLTIIFNQSVMKHMNTKCDDNINFFQSTHNAYMITLFKADTGYRIVRVPHRKKTYQITVRHPIQNINEFENKACTYYLKKNGFIRVALK